MERLTRPLTINVKRSPMLLAFLGIILAVIILSGIVLFKFGALTLVLGHPIILPNSDTVVTQVQNIGKYETVDYTLEKVITYDQDANSIWRFLGDHTKLFIVHGDVIAGFDLTTLTKNDVQIQGQSKVTLNMPPPKILVAILDEAKTRIYDANSGLLGLFGGGIDSNTTLQILAAAKVSLQNAACQGGILQKAADSARQQLSSFLMTVGFKNVTINIPTGTC